MNNDIRDYEAFLQGDNQGFERIVIRYREHLIYFIYRYINNLHLAEELAQDVFVELLLHKERYDLKSNLKTYLYTIGRNKAIDYIRRHKKEMILDEICEDYPVEEKEELEARILKEEEKKLLYHCLGKMKEEYQHAIYLVDMEELSYAEAAEVLEKSISQVKVLLHRARKALKKIMVQEGYQYEN